MLITTITVITFTCGQNNPLEMQNHKTLVVWDKIMSPRTCSCQTSQREKKCGLLKGYVSAHPALQESRNTMLRKRIWKQRWEVKGLKCCIFLELLPWGHCCYLTLILVSPAHWPSIWFISEPIGCLSSIAQQKKVEKWATLTLHSCGNMKNGQLQFREKD